MTIADCYFFFAYVLQRKRKCYCYWGDVYLLVRGTFPGYIKQNLLRVLFLNKIGVLMQFSIGIENKCNFHLIVSLLCFLSALRGYPPKVDTRGAPKVLYATLAPSVQDKTI